nr:hypothetical protein [Haliscomenobacter sp.]
MNPVGQLNNSVEKPEMLVENPLTGCVLDTPPELFSGYETTSDSVLETPPPFAAAPPKSSESPERRRRNLPKVTPQVPEVSKVVNKTSSAAAPKQPSCEPGSTLTLPEKLPPPRRLRRPFPYRPTPPRSPGQPPGLRRLHGPLRRSLDLRPRTRAHAHRPGRVPPLRPRRQLHPWRQRGRRTHPPGPPLDRCRPGQWPKALGTPPQPLLRCAQPKGFKATKAWFKKHQQAKIAIKDRELLTKAVNFYLASLRPEATIAPVEAYRRVTQTLGKRKAALVQIFHTEIQNTVPHVNSNHAA